MKEVNGMTFKEVFTDTGVHIGCFGGCTCSQYKLNFNKKETTGCFPINLEKMVNNIINKEVNK